MKSTQRDWYRFWASRSTPEWRFQNERYYAQYAAELRVLFHNTHPRRVLELGCGDGSLFPYLGFPEESYKGVDFSESMLTVFRRRYPHLALECAPGHLFRDGQTYDLIFTNGLVQYLDRETLGHFMDNGVRMMAPGSLLICGSIPWRLRRLGYYGGTLSSAWPPPLPWRILGSLRKMWRNPIGYWYSLQDFRRIARALGLTLELYGSAVHLYRFHAVFRRA